MIQASSLNPKQAAECRSFAACSLEFDPRQGCFGPCRAKFRNSQKQTETLAANSRPSPKTSDQVALHHGLAFIVGLGAGFGCHAGNNRIRFERVKGQEFAWNASPFRRSGKQDRSSRVLEESSLPGASRTRTPSEMYPMLGVGAKGGESVIVDTLGRVAERVTNAGRAWLLFPLDPWAWHDSWDASNLL